VGVDQAGMIADSRWEFCGGQPRLHITIAKGIGHAQHLGASVLGVVVHAVLFKVTAAAGFKITK